MDKLVAAMDADFDDVEEDKSVSPTQPVLLSQQMHLLQNNDQLLIDQKKVLEKVDLQSLLSESSSSITEEEFIDTKKRPHPANYRSDEPEDISESSQSQQQIVTTKKHIPLKKPSKSKV